MKILFIGDIFGEAGRGVVGKYLSDVKAKFSPDLTIANGENLSHGNGFSFENIKEMTACGIDFFTMGNHVWGNKEGFSHLDEANFPVVRPANFPPAGVPGRGYQVVKTLSGKNVLIINLSGRVFMGKDFDCPFRITDEILEKTKNEDLSAIFVDFHAEATSEKYALAYYLDGRISALVGTHTHVQTVDARILEGGTAYISDVGMTGSFDSVIGVKKDVILNGFLTQMPFKLEPESSGKMIFNAVIIDIDEKSKKALNIERIFEIF